MSSKIVFIHSLNNYTGSPNVLSVVIKGLLGRGYTAKVITSRGDGFLSNIANVEYQYTCYRWSDNRIATLLRLIFSQIGLFLSILCSSRKHIYYINTIVPFGAIVACRISGKRFVIHVHESMRQRKPLYPLFRVVYKWCNTKSIFVSRYLQNIATECRDGRVIHNSLPKEYNELANHYLKQRELPCDSILMVTSLRRFKGIYEFAELARRMPQHQFELVLSATQSEVEEFAKEVSKPKNLKIWARQTNLHPFYRRAKLLLQLSHPESWVETFGLTILEAMAYGVPAIVPNVGGPTEIVKDAHNGFAINPHEILVVAEKIEILMADEELYRQFAERSIIQSRKFDEENMINKIENYIQ